MTSIIVAKKNGKDVGYNIQWHEEDGQCHTISLSARQHSEKNARRLADAVEALLYCQRNGTIPDKVAKRCLKVISQDSSVNRRQYRFITRDEYAKFLEACSTQEERSILALSRIGGLRCPLELEPLRWLDIDWERNRFLVCSPKTERHEKHQERFVPLFRELRKELEALRSQSKPAEDGFIIQHYQGTNWNLRGLFDTIARKAGVGKIVHPFDNMRMSRSNEIFRDYGPQKENLWLGRSSLVMVDHYFHSTDEDFIVDAED